MKTKDKILLASLDLFNERGERNITTNHIAAELNMSPGNLYYHFRNKSDIIYEIFVQYELLVDHYLHIPDDQTLTLDHLVGYLEAVFEGLWAYRFFHRDLEFLLGGDERLRKDYRAFTFRCLDAIKKILKGLQAGLDGVLVELDDEHLESMALNVWLAVTNWMAYLKTAHAGEEDEVIDKGMLKQGIYQVLSFTVPYLTENYLDEIRVLQDRYRPRPITEA